MPLCVVVEDDNPLTQNIVADLLGHVQLDAHLGTREAALRSAALARRCVVLVLPAGFGTATRSRKAPPSVPLLHDARSDFEARWVEGIFTEVVMRRLAREWLGPLATGLSERPFTVERQQAVPTANAYAHSFCGMTIQYLLFWGMDSGLLLLRERRRGLWRRVRVAPVPLSTLLLGKVAATSGIALTMIAVTFGFGWLVFGVRVSGSAVAFVALAVAVSLLAAATGLFVAAVGGTEGRTRSVAILVILALAMLGGLWLPAFLLPEWVRTGSLALPTTWALRGLEGVVAGGMTGAEALPSLAAILAFTVVLLSLALAGFAWREVRGIGVEDAA